MRHQGERSGGGGGGGFRELVGAIKDKASQTRATLQPPSPYQLPLLRSTTHSPTAPPSLRHLSYLLTLSNSSRSSASSLVSSLMDRLRQTRSSPVALKCLFSFHFFLRHGPFILLDQLSFLPLLGGRNYLNLSSFRDSSSPLSWDLSAWVRWYASYLERAVSSSRSLGHHFLNSSSPSYDESKVSGFANHDLLVEMESLAGLIEETIRIPDSCRDNPIVKAVKEYVMDDCRRVVNAVSVRINEFGERIELLSFADSVEAVCSMKRLEACGGRVEEMLDGEDRSSSSAAVRRIWDSIRMVRGKVGKTRKVGWSESERFEVGRLPRLSDSVMFPSGRLAADPNFLSPKPSTTIPFF